MSSMVGIFSSSKVFFFPFFPSFLSKKKSNSTRYQRSVPVSCFILVHVSPIFNLRVWRCGIVDRLFFMFSTLSGGQSFDFAVFFLSVFTTKKFGGCMCVGWAEMSFCVISITRVIVSIVFTCAGSGIRCLGGLEPESCGPVSCV